MMLIILNCLYYYNRLSVVYTCQLISTGTPDTINIMQVQLREGSYCHTHLSTLLKPTFCLLHVSVYHCLHCGCNEFNVGSNEGRFILSY